MIMRFTKTYPVHAQGFDEWLESMYPSYLGMSTSGNDIELEFEGNLAAEHVASINDYWNSMTESGEAAKIAAAQALASARTAIVKGMEFGRELIADVGAENLLLNLTISQTMAMAQKYAGVISLLMTGSIKSALTVIEMMPPDEVVTAERIRKYSNKIRTYLGMPLLP